VPVKEEKGSVQVRCYNCRRVVPQGRYCIYCGRELRRTEPVSLQESKPIPPAMGLRETLFDRILTLENELKKLQGLIGRRGRKQITVVRSPSVYTRLKLPVSQ